MLLLGPVDLAYLDVPCVMCGGTYTAVATGVVALDCREVPQCGLMCYLFWLRSGMDQHIFEILSTLEGKSGTF